MITRIHLDQHTVLSELHLDLRRDIGRCLGKPVLSCLELRHHDGGCKDRLNLIQAMVAQLVRIRIGPYALHSIRISCKEMRQELRGKTLGTDVIVQNINLIHHTG